jgi:hypothetical protein
MGVSSVQSVQLSGSQYIYSMDPRSLQSSFTKRGILPPLTERNRESQRGKVMSVPQGLTPSQLCTAEKRRQWTNVPLPPSWCHKTLEFVMSALSGSCPYSSVDIEQTSSAPLRRKPTQMGSPHTSFHLSYGVLNRPSVD